MKRFIFYIILFHSLCASAQPRVNGTTELPKLQKSSLLMSNIVGWSYDDEKQRWCGYYNALIDEYRNNSNTPKKMSATYLAKQKHFAAIPNLISLQTKKYTFENRTYYMFFAKYYDCDYDYPELQLGFHLIKCTDVFVTTEKEFAKIRHSNNSLDSILVFNIGSTPYVENWYKSYRNYSSMFMDVFHHNDTIIERTLEKYRNKGANAFDETINCKYFYVKKENDRVQRFSCIVGMPVASDEKLKNAYYEVPMSEWNKLKIE